MQDSAVAKPIFESLQVLRSKIDLWDQDQSLTIIFCDSALYCL